MGTEEVTADNASMTGGLEDSVQTTTDTDNIVELTVGPEDTALTMETDDIKKLLLGTEVTECTASFDTSADNIFE